MLTFWLATQFTTTTTTSILIYLFIHAWHHQHHWLILTTAPPLLGIASATTILIALYRNLIYHSDHHTLAELRAQHWLRHTALMLLYLFTAYAAAIALLPLQILRPPPPYDNVPLRIIGIVLYQFTSTNIIFTLSILGSNYYCPSTLPWLAAGTLLSLLLISSVILIHVFPED